MSGLTHRLREHVRSHSSTECVYHTAVLCFFVGTGLPAMQATRCIRHKPLMPSQRCGDPTSPFSQLIGVSTSNLHETRLEAKHFHPLRGRLPCVELHPHHRLVHRRAVLHGYVSAVDRLAWHHNRLSLL